MSERVKNKLEQLIRDLENAAAEQVVQDSSNPAQLEGEASSVSLGLSDVTKTETTDSGSDTTPGTQHGQSSRLVGSSGAKRHVAELEGKVLELLLERKAAETRHARELSLRDAELARLQQYIDDELMELHARQAQVEESAPSVRLQLQEARSALRNISISDERYQQLKRVPADQQLLADAVRICVHEQLQELAGDNERLRLAAAAARETAARAEDDVSRLQRENARLAAAVAEKEAAVESTVAALQSRCARLAAELEDAAVALEVCKAKAGMYDELQAKAERLDAEVSRLSAAEAAAERLRVQLAAADAAVGDKDATLSLLLADKAYLSKEVQVCEERVAELSSRLASQESKVGQLKAERQELYQKLAAAAEATRNQGESRMEREVSRLQATAASDLERIRKEAAETSEREARLLRDLRDAALDEASRLRTELRQLRTQHEELLLSSRSAAAALGVSHSELLGELKLKGFELTRLQALCEERGTSLSQANLQLEMLTEKAQLLTAELNQQEQDANELVRELQQQLAAAQGKLQEYQAAEGILDKAVLGAAAAGDSAVAGLHEQLAALMPPSQAAAAGQHSGSSPMQQQQQQQLSGAMQRRIQHNIQLAARCAKLESEKQQLAREGAEMQGKLSKAQAALEKLHSQLQLAGQPHGFLLTQLAAAEAAASQAQEQLAAAQDALRRRDEQAREAAAERAALRRDLESILRERGTLDSMRRMVGSLVGSPAGAAAAAAGIGAVGGQPTGAAMG
ncbi:hypothetical protein OEZ85_003586 [Tetradesmus obliquus]|uniref:Uncharacterized protein n=1 Tax=Tetradesmus obliquus TaxID=3088 RepID=A0ABY8UC13_TETOB|nr:hypothetical protein OEZ85_003586 [Tetradesmus obliquus]